MFDNKSICRKCLKCNFKKNINKNLKKYLILIALNILSKIKVQQIFLSFSIIMNFFFTIKIPKVPLITLHLIFSIINLYLFTLCIYVAVNLLVLYYN